MQIRVILHRHHGKAMASDISDLSPSWRHYVLNRANNLKRLSPGVGISNAPFVVSVSKIFDVAILSINFFESHSYFTGVDAAELRRHRSHINVVFNISRVFDNAEKNQKATERSKLACEPPPQIWSLHRTSQKHHLMMESSLSNMYTDVFG